MQITGGSVRFGRKVAPAQYENKEAVVEIFFTLAEGEDLGNSLDAAASVAQHKTLELVGAVIKSPVAAYGRSPAMDTLPTIRALNTEAASELAAKHLEAVKQEDPGLQAAAAAVAKKPGRPKKVDPPQSDDWDAPSSPAAKPVTDAELLDGCRRCADRTHNNLAIRSLVDEYAGSKSARVASIPQEKRAEFLLKLEEVGTPGEETL